MQHTHVELLCHTSDACHFEGSYLYRAEVAALIEASISKHLLQTQRIISVLLLFVTAKLMTISGRLESEFRICPSLLHVIVEKVV